MIRLNLKNSAQLLILSACVLLVGVGCDKFKKKAATPPVAQQPQVQKVVPPVGSVVQKQVSSVKLPAQPVNQFDFSTKKDPFKPYVVAKQPIPAAGKGAKAELSALPIHSFDISQFRLVGVVADTKGNKAMVVDPTGKAYVIKTGMTIGKNEGKVVHIATAGVDVVEQFRDDNNKIRKETIRIPLLRKP